MNRLFSSLPSPASPPSIETGPSSLLARSLREPSLMRLAQSIQELNPELARALCRDWLQALEETGERAVWHQRLASWLGDDERDPDAPPTT